MAGKINNMIRCFAVAACALSAPVAMGGIAPFELDDIDYYAGIFTLVDEFDTGMADDPIIGVHLSDVLLETYDNTGQPNWASEALLAVGLAQASGESLMYIFAPFENEDSQGIFNLSYWYADLDGAGYFVPDDGVIRIYAVGSWSDGSGLPSGTWLEGLVEVDFGVPAPGAIAILLAAGAVSRRRRRT